MDRKKAIPHRTVVGRRRKKEGEMETARRPRLTLKFKGRDAFGNFCVALTEDNVPFSVGPFRTVFISEMQLKQLPDKSRALFDDFMNKGLVEASSMTPVGKRHLPTPEEADKILKELIESF